MTNNKPWYSRTFVSQKDAIFEKRMAGKIFACCILLTFELATFESISIL
jgi:hypothetical protein